MQEVKQIMRLNISKVAQRGEKLSTIEDEVQECYSMTGTEKSAPLCRLAIEVETSEVRTPILIWSSDLCII